MTTTTNHPLGASLDLPCPDWCTLRPGHPWDAETAEGLDLRGHAGPAFGRHVSTYATEYARALTFSPEKVLAGEPGVLTYGVCLSDAADLNNMTVDQAHGVGWSLMRAASWAAENRP